MTRPAEVVTSSERSEAIEVNTAATRDVARLALAVDPIELVANWWQKHKVGQRLGKVAAGSLLIAGGGSLIGGSEAHAAGGIVVLNGGSEVLPVCGKITSGLLTGKAKCKRQHDVAPGASSAAVVNGVAGVSVPAGSRLQKKGADGWATTFTGNNCSPFQDDPKVVDVRSYGFDRRSGVTGEPLAELRVEPCSDAPKQNSGGGSGKKSSGGGKSNGGSSSGSDCGLPWPAGPPAYQCSGRDTPPKRSRKGKESEASKQDTASNCGLGCSFMKGYNSRKNAAGAIEFMMGDGREVVASRADQTLAA